MQKLQKKLAKNKSTLQIMDEAKLVKKAGAIFP